MKIEINFEGLNKIFCKLGLHRWAYERDQWSSRYQKYIDYKFCLDCMKEQE